MKDNFDLKKFLVENKTIENSNPFLKEDARTDAEEEGYKDGLKDGEEDKKSSLREKVREMIINELSDGIDPYDEDLDDPETIRGNYGDDEIDDESYYQHSHKTDIELEEMMDPEEEEEEETFIDPAGGIHDADEDDYAAMYVEESLDEAKEDEEEEAPEEEVEAEEEETEEVDVEAEEEPKSGGGIEDIAADMEGNEGDLMDHLISALKVSKGMDNEKLTTQIGNTLKFFVGEYIGGEE